MAKKSFKELETIAFDRLHWLLKNTPKEKIEAYLTEDGVLFTTKNAAQTHGGKKKLAVLVFNQDAKGFKKVKQAPQKK